MTSTWRGDKVGAAFPPSSSDIRQQYHAVVNEYNG
jgi:hypothetical protein